MTPPASEPTKLAQAYSSPTDGAEPRPPREDSRSDREHSVCGCMRAASAQRISHGVPHATRSRRFRLRERLNWTSGQLIKLRDHNWVLCIPALSAMPSWAGGAELSAAMRISTYFGGAPRGFTTHFPQYRGRAVARQRSAHFNGRAAEKCAEPRGGSKR